MNRNARRNAIAAVTQGRAGVRADPFDELAIGIVEFAANDYRSFMAKKRRLEKKKPSIQVHEALIDVNYQIMRIEKFFKSDWCFALSGGTNIAIFERLQEEQEE